MVQVSVGGKQVDGLQAVVFDVVGDCLALLGVEGAAVDDDAFLRLVAHHIAVLLEHVALEAFDV